MYNSGYVTLSSDKGKFLWFDVYDDEAEEKNLLVKIGYDDEKGYIILDCSCKYCGLKAKHNPICSHKLACIFYLEHEHIKIGRKKW